MEHLASLISIDEEDNIEYKDEFTTMCSMFYLKPQEEKLHMRKVFLQCFEKLEETEKMDYDLTEDESCKIEKSKHLRLLGNNLFTAKGDKRNVLGACRLYNDAIYAAIGTKGEELALGFANRAAALQTFGYHQQAYDDCVCALKLGYPKVSCAKIIMRQAYCSIKMADFNKAEKHLTQLQDLTLNDSLSKELRELLKDFDELKSKTVNDSNKNGHPSVVETIDKILTRKTEEIITTEKGRCLQAKESIKISELIFSERISAFVPVVDSHQMCHQCGTLNFIPIPCLYCRGRVNYCSLKCQEKNIELHEYECPGYRIQFFQTIGIGHLALRIVLSNGIFSILDELKLDNKNSTIDVWLDLTEGGHVWKNYSIPYAASLRMITHLNKSCPRDIKCFSLMSQLLVVYLKKYTNYFKNLNVKNNKINWKLLTASLILLHIGQSMSNGQSLSAILPQELNLTESTFEYHMLNEKVWSSPWHIKLGCLNFFSNYAAVSASNLPYLSLCNHSCVQALAIKFSGRYISAYAVRDLKKDEEVTNCYDLDCRKTERKKRRKRLRDTYHFECQCEDCIRTDSEDVEYNKFRQYRCDNTKCEETFVASNSQVPTFNILDNNLHSTNVKVFCSVCGCKQIFKWSQDGKYLDCSEPNHRRRLYQIFKKSNKYLLGFNEARYLLTRNIVTEWFKLQWLNVHLNDQDYCDLIDMIKYTLIVTKAQNSIFSTAYVADMIYLWDLIAKRKYKCSKTDMDEMLLALNIVSDDLKVIFLNYYNDFMKDLPFY